MATTLFLGASACTYTLYTGLAAGTVVLMALVAQAGERVVVLAPGRELSADELRAWLKEQLSAYKVPHLIRFDDALPKGATGKILKRAIEWTTDEGATP